ncbi:MAG: prolipoprotein diacylglyceryl transferase [Clostridia bacterium]|nr:prolipoprotein diacylglyceryl transferase [Clostridia bacterium]
MLKFTQTAIEIFNFPIRYYGILIALGVFSGVFIAEKREKRYGFPKDTVIDLSLWVLPMSIIGARLYYVLFNLDFYIQDPISVFSIRSGGMAIYGGILFGILTGFLFSKKRKLSFFSLADLAAPSVALGQAVGRWGNFINQEAFGMEITNPALQFFPFAVYIERLNAWHAAAFFYESVWCLCIVFSILLLEKKKAFAFPGAAFIYYAVLYSFERAIVEGIRTDSLYISSIRVSQALSALIILLCLGYLLISSKPSKKRRAAAVLPSAAALTALIDAVFSFGFTKPLFIPSLAISSAFSIYLIFVRSVSSRKKTINICTEAEADRN